MNEADVLNAISITGIVAFVVYSRRFWKNGHTKKQ